MMKNEIPLQLRQALIALACGGAAGAVYELMAVFRERWRALALPLDALFCLASAAALFALGYGPGLGELRLFMILCYCGGMGAYFALLGRSSRRAGRKIRAIGGKAERVLTRPAKKALRRIKKVSFFEKNSLKSCGNGLNYIVGQIYLMVK